MPTDHTHPTAEALFAGVDLGGTNIQAGVVDAGGSVLSRARCKTRAERGLEAVLARIERVVHEACSGLGIEPSKLDGIGLGSPGGVDPNSGMVQDAENLGWRDIPLAQLLRHRLHLPVAIDNDVNCAALAEQRLGAGAGSQAMLAVWIGTGIGGGLVLGNQLYRGHFLSAGEFGQWPIFPWGMPASRTIEQNASRLAVAKQLRHFLDAGTPTALRELIEARAKERGEAASEASAEPVKSKLIAEAYASGDALTREVVHRAGELIASVVAGCVSLLSLECVVVGGGLAEAIGQPLVDVIGKAARPLIFPRRARDVRVVLTKLGDNAGVVGASLLAREAILGPNPRA